MGVKVRRNEGADRREVHIWVERTPDVGDERVNVFRVQYRLEDNLASRPITVMWFRRDDDNVARPDGSRRLHIDPGVDDPDDVEIALAEILDPRDATTVVGHLRADLYGN